MFDVGKHASYCNTEVVVWCPLRSTFVKIGHFSWFNLQLQFSSRGCANSNLKEVMCGYEVFFFFFLLTQRLVGVKVPGF